MTLRYAPTATVRHNETLPGGEIEISIIVRYIQADYPAEQSRVRDRAFGILHDLTAAGSRYGRDTAD